MEIQLTRIPEAQKPVLRQLLEFYCYDFSEFIYLELDEEGYFNYPYLDHYWIEEDRHPFFILRDNVIVGFVLVNRHGFIQKKEEGYTMAEFFVMRGHRRRGIGIQAAHLAFDLFPGKWEVAQQLSNQASVHFWDDCISTYLNGLETVKVVFLQEKMKRVMLFSTHDRQAIEKV